MDWDALALTRNAAKSSRRESIYTLVKRPLVPTVIAVAAMLIAGCANDGAVSGGGGIVCPDLVEVLTRLYYPAPGATGVPTAVGVLIVGSPADGAFRLQAKNASPISLASAEPARSPLPTSLPTAPPPYTIPYYAIPVPTLSPGVTYSVIYAAPASSSPCGSDEQSGTIGTFST